MGSPLFTECGYCPNPTIRPSILNIHPEHADSEAGLAATTG
ncbi:MAG: hypothetical protein ACTS2F_13715 [Thainema sp.]